MKILGFRRDAGQTEGATGPECDRQTDKKDRRAGREASGQAECVVWWWQRRGEDLFMWLAVMLSKYSC